MTVFSRLDALPALSPEERQLLDSVKALARDQIMPRAAEYDVNAEFPWDNIRAINAIGALCITEPDSGSDATHMTTRFTPDASDIVVSGGKTFISNGDVADLYLVFGKWAELGASPSDKNGRNAISALYLEKGTPGLAVLRTEDKMGHRAASTAAIAFDGCRV